MKNIYSLLVCLLLTKSDFAANLTATPTPASFSKKDGKIALSITGGFAPYTILWSGPSGYTSSKLNPDSLAAGTYCVTVTDQYCGVAKLCVTVSEKTNSISEIIAAKMNVYPNPFSNQLFIEISKGNIGNAKLELYDQSGKLVASDEMKLRQSTQWKLNSSLPSGVYLLNVTLEDGSILQSKVTSIGK